MNIQSISSANSIQTQSTGKNVMSAYSPGDVFPAEVTSADQGRVTLRLPGGGKLEADQRAMEPLRQGDQVMLMVGAEEGNATPRLELMSVNGQPVKTGASPMEYALLNMRIAPTSANLATAASLARLGMPLQPSTFARLNELAIRFPTLTGDAALLMASSSLPINESSVQAFTQWLANPAEVADFTNAAQTLAAQDPLAAATLESAALLLRDNPTQTAKTAPAPAFGQTADLQTAATPLTAQPTELPAQAAANGAPQAQNITAEQAAHTAQQAPAGTASPAASDAALPAQASAAPALSVATGPDGMPILQSDASTQQGAPGSAQGGHSRGAALSATLGELFAALDGALPAEQGRALRDAALSLRDRLQDFTTAVRASSGTDAMRMRPVMELGQTLVTQTQMGGELSNLLYVPLPFTMNQTQQEASMYVLRRDARGSRLDEANVSVAICLDTENLGTVETLLRVERSELSLVFRVDSQESLTFFRDRLRQVSQLALPAQYHFKQASAVLRDAPITPVSAGQILQQAFDLRAPGGLDISI